MIIRSSEYKRTVYPPCELAIPPQNKSRSYIRFALFSPGVPSSDVFIDNKIIASEMNFGNYTSYYTYPSGPLDISIYASGSEQDLLLQKKINLPTNTLLTVAAINEVDNMDLQLMNDTVATYPNNVIAKFANLSPNAPALDLIINLSPLYSNVSYTFVTDYNIIELDVDYDLIFRESASDKLLLNVPNMVLTPGKSYTFYAIGLVDALPKFQLISTLDGSSYLLD